MDKLSIAPFSKQELLHELRGVLVNFAYALGHLYCHKNSYRLLGLECQINPEEKYQDPFIENEGLLASLNIDDFWVTSEVSMLYDYAFEAIDYGVDWSVISEDINPFINDLSNSELLATTVTAFSGLTTTVRKCKQVIDIASARAYLSGDDNCYLSEDTPADHLSLRQIAWLAGIDEKTARNLAGPKSKQPLKTVSVGSRTYVAFDVAKAWLQARGQYKEIVRASPEDIRDFNLRGFASLDDLNRYIDSQCARLQITRSKLTELLAQSIPSGEEGLRSLTSDGVLTSADFSMALGNILQAEAKSFSLALFKLCQKIAQEKFETAIAVVAINSNPLAGSW